MKAPQTIYLTPLLVEGCGKSLSKRVTENDVVYIRKDFLLEWAKEQSASCDGAVAMKRAYDKLIDKLNSL